MSSHHTRRHLPSLRAMQGFEVAFRHQTFTGAAHELGVSQGAVSRQVQELERWLGVELFIRSGPHLRLTTTGKALGDQIGRAMDLIQEAIDRATPVNGSRFVTLSMLPSVAAKWLAPRLGRFIEQHPEIDLRVTASRHFVDFHAEEVDAAVRYGKGNWPGLTTELLATETVIPVCTPDYAALIGLNDPNDLRRATLLKSDLEENWDAWFKAAGLSAEPAIRGPKLGDDTATLQAVLDSQGVCLGRSILIAEDLRAGRLIAPFALRLNAAFSYWFVMPSSATSNADIASVRDWLANEFSVAVC